MIGAIQGKIWGKTSCLFSKNNVEIHRIEADKGGYCSKHSHSSKWNQFYVERGKLKISIYKDGEIVDFTVLTDGMTTSVAPNEIHQFEALEDTIAYEIYWAELQEIDINRIDIGGVKIGLD
jgi:quercetin dioxygenase-like cupin family protein